jgi:hypothetical protein
MIFWLRSGFYLAAFCFSTPEKLAIALFIVGSAQFLARPSIRLAAHIHLRRQPESHWQQ